MEKVRIGNDLKVNFSVYRNGEPESFEGATNISTKIVNESYNKTIAHTYSIVDNVIQFNIDALELKQCGKCRVFISYTKDGDYTVDSPAFELVQYTEDTGGTEVIGIEIVKINISGDIGINRDGSSAYEVWEAYPGNEGKTIEQYFEWLHENPTKVDTSRTITAGNGLTGGGDLTEDRTINIGNTDDSIVVGEDGIKVDTQDTLTSDSASKPLSAKQGKSLQDNKAEKTRNIVAGDGLTGGGDLTEDRTININPADDSLTVTADNVKVNTNNTLTSTSTTQPLSANQGKVLNEKVVQVETDLNEKLELKADLIEGTVPAEQLPPDLIRTTLYLTQVGHRKRRIQDSFGVEDGTMLWTIVSGTEYLASLSETLGLGLYLVSQDLTSYKKLSKTNSNLYADGTPAKLDGTEGDIQMCWRKPIYVKYYEKQEADGLYEHIEISHLNILGECEMIVPGGGFPAVLNRTTGDLRALYSTDPNYRGGNNATAYDSDPVKTLIGKPATNLSAYSGEVAAKKRGALWTTGGTPFFATLAILQIMLFGTNHAQDAIVSDDVLVAGEGFQSCKKNASGLYSGGFGVNNGFPQWSTYNANNPTFDLSAGFSYGDITGRRVYIINDWPTAGTNQTISLAYFFGMPYPFNHYWHGDAHQRVDQQTEAQGFKTVVYQKRDITAAPISGGPSANGVAPSAPWEKVAEASRTEGYIRRTSFNALCLIPTVAGSPGSSNKFYPDYFYNNGTTSFGWRAPFRFAHLALGAIAGPFIVYVNLAPTDAHANYGAFCCHFSSGIVPKKLPG